jgi:hypothetical protein
MIGRPSTSKPVRMLHPAASQHNDVITTSNARPLLIVRGRRRTTTYILPVAASILTSSGGISSGLNSRRHSMVPLMRFRASSSFHLEARRYRASVSGLSSHRRSHGAYESVSGR